MSQKASEQYQALQAQHAMEADENKQAMSNLLSVHTQSLDERTRRLQEELLESRDKTRELLKAADAAHAETKESHRHALRQLQIDHQHQVARLSQEHDQDLARQLAQHSTILTRLKNTHTKLANEQQESLNRLLSKLI